MKADYIKKIIKEYDKMPYDCILIDGTWGIEKTYAIKDALKERKNVCIVSLFGMKDVQQVFHETFYQFGLKDKSGIRKSYNKSNKKLRGKMGIPSIIKRMTGGQGSIRSGVGNCSTFALSLCKLFNT